MVGEQGRRTPRAQASSGRRGAKPAQDARRDTTGRGGADRGAAGRGGVDRGGPARTNDSRETRPGRTVPAPAAPDLPDEAQVELLDRATRDAVGALGGVIAGQVGRHLAAAGLLVDEDPQRALLHAQAARARAPRLAAAREAVGICAYAAGEFLLARSELRAARRITGQAELLPVLADCERGLGHPERALAVAADPDAARLDADQRVELAIVVAGARRDLGQLEAAVQALRLPRLAVDDADPTTVRLWYAYADAQLAAGRRDEAATYFEKVVRADDDADTDAAERLAALTAR